MGNKDVYELMIQQRGAAYRDSQIKSHSHYRDPIDSSPGRPAGHSHIWGDASAEVQSRAIDALIAASERARLNSHETAHVLAIARVESGFNPDAAAGTTSAHGLGQFVDKTGAHYGIDDNNRNDVNKQAEVLVAHYQDNAAIAKAREQGEEYIYKYHHDGPKQDYGGLAISQRNVMPYLGQYEQFVRQHQQRKFDPLHDIRHLGERIQQGALTFGTPMTSGMPDYLRVNTLSQSPAHLGHTLAPSQHPSPARDTAFNNVLRHGAQNSAVVALQQSLNLLGATDRDGRAPEADGLYGKSTHEAVENFQLWSGLPTTGIADRTTLDAVRVQASFAAARQAMGQQPGTHLVDNLTATGPINARDAAELNRYEANHSRALRSAPDPATRSQEPSRGPDARDPRASTSGSLNPSLQHSNLRDFRDAHNPDHGLYAELKQRLPPETSEDRLVQITAACQINGMRKAEQIGRIDVTDTAVFIQPATILLAGSQTKVDITTPPPPQHEAMRQVETHDQQQAVQLAQFQEQQRQIEARAQQSPGMMMG